MKYKYCKRCSSLAGVYEYPDVPEDVYRRHENCRCTVEYDPGDGKKLQNVHTKKWISKEESVTLEKRKKIGLNIKNSSRFLPDITIGRSVGAKSRNYDILDLETMECYHFAEGSRLQNVEVFAGKGSRTVYRDAYKYADTIGGKISDWQHVKGHGIIATDDGDRPAEVHWSQCEGLGKHDFFIKRWEDE